MTFYQKVQQTSVLYNLFSLPYIVPYLVGKVPHIIQNSIIWGTFLCTYVLNRMKLTFNSIFNV